MNKICDSRSSKGGILVSLFRNNTLKSKYDLLLLFLLVLVTIVVLVMLLPSGSEAKIVTVDNDGNADFTSVQEAIDAITTLPGDEITVAEGNYHENVTVNKSLTIIGNGAKTTSIIANGEGHVVRIMTPGVEFSGFHVTGGEVTRFGAGISIESDGNRIFGNNCSGNNQGIVLENCSFNEISDNSCWDNYRGITFLHNANNNYVHDNICAFNKDMVGIAGYGMYIVSSANTITGNRCFSNEDHGIIVEGTTLNTITGNNCSRNGGHGIRSLLSQGMIVANNRCSDNGEFGIYSDQGNSYFIHDNYIKNNQNGAINVESSTNLTLYENEMIGGGLLMTGKNIEHWETHIIPANNTVNGNPVYYNKQSSDIWVPLGSGQVIIANCSNIVVHGQNVSESTGGVELAFSSNITISNTTCSDNLYGIYIYRCENPGPLDDIILTNNSLESNLIGIYVDGGPTCDISVHYNEFVGNVEYGIYIADDVETVNATLNWWGHNSGPYHSEENSDGEGDSVSDRVLFHPWIQRTHPPENTKPRIITEDETEAVEREEYSMEYEALDDEDDDLLWHLVSNSSFLTIDSESGHLHGVPEQDDVGAFWVNVSVSDGKLGDYHNFSITVVNVNDQPEVLFIQPEIDEVVYGTIVISGTASDQDSEVVSVELRIENGTWKQVNGIEEWTYNLDTTILKNGFRTIEVRAFDEELFYVNATREIHVKNDPEEICLPDFSVTGDDISIKGSLQIGIQTNISVVIRNVGDLAGPVILKLYCDSISLTSFIGEKYLKLAARSNETVLVSWIPWNHGMVTIYIVLEDNSGMGELDFRNNHAFQTFIIPEPMDPSDDGSDDGLEIPIPKVPNRDARVYISLGTFGVILCLMNTERGKFIGYSLMMMLYTRISKDKLVIQYNRGRIMGYIEANPQGLYLSEIVTSLKLKYGTAVYHLRMLEESKLITSKGMNTGKIFYPKRGGDVYGEKRPIFEKGKYYPSKIQQAIIEIIKKNKEISQADITRILGMERKALSYHIKKLKKAKIIRVKKSGRQTYCSLRTN